MNQFNTRWKEYKQLRTSMTCQLISEVKRGHWPLVTSLIQEEFEDTKGVIRIRKWKKEKQHNGQKKKYKGTYNDL